MPLSFSRKQSHIPDKSFELFVEDRKRISLYLILVPVALFLIAAGCVLYKKHLDEDSAMQEALTSQPVSVPVLLTNAGAAEVGLGAPVQNAAPARKDHPQEVQNVQEARRAQEAENKKAIESAILDWKHAWESSNVPDYLSHYAADFTPEDGSSLEQWKALRSERLEAADNIEISLSNLDIRFESADAATVAFDQAYRSQSFTDNTRQVHLVRQHEGTRKNERPKAD